MRVECRIGLLDRQLTPGVWYIVISISSQYMRGKMQRHTTGRGSVVLDGLALSVEGIVLWTQARLRSSLGMAAEGREGGAGYTGGEHGVGIGRWWRACSLMRFVTVLSQEVVVKATGLPALAHGPCAPPSLSLPLRL